MTVVINESNLQAFLHNPAGGIAQFMGNVLAPQILQESKDYCSRPWPGRPWDTARYPPPGPPYRREKDKVSPDLVDSMIVTSAPGPQGVEFFISPTAIKRGWNYGLILKEREYHFLPDSYYNT